MSAASHRLAHDRTEQIWMLVSARGVSMRRDEFNPSQPFKRQVWSFVAVIPVLERQRWDIPWSLLVGQPRLTHKLQGCLKNKVGSH